MGYESPQAVFSGRVPPQSLEAERAVLGACKYGFFRQEPKPGK